MAESSLNHDTVIIEHADTSSTSRRRSDVFSHVIFFFFFALLCSLFLFSVCPQLHICNRFFTAFSVCMTWVFLTLPFLNGSYCITDFFFFFIYIFISKVESVASFLIFLTLLAGEHILELDWYIQLRPAQHRCCFFVAPITDVSKQTPMIWHLVNEITDHDGLNYAHRILVI